MNRVRKLLLLLMVVVMLVCAGCDKQGQNGGDTGDNPKPEKTETLDTKSQQNDKDPELPPNPPQHKSTNDSKHNGEARTTKEMKIKVYYPDESGLRLVGVNREIEISAQDDKYKAAVEAVMTPPKEKNLTSVIPNNSSLISVKVKDGTAVVNLDKKIKNGFSGGSTGEEFLIGSVVNTLTEFKEVKNVKFLIDGQEVETLSGHMDLSEPVERMNNLMSN